jgi:hypothetical protein
MDTRNRRLHHGHIRDFWALGMVFGSNRHLQCGHELLLFRQVLFRQIFKRLQNAIRTGIHGDRRAIAPGDHSVLVDHKQSALAEAIRSAVSAILTGNGSLGLKIGEQRQAEDILRADPDVFGTFAVPGFSLAGGSSSNYGLIFAPLKPIDDRKSKGHAASDIVVRVSPKLFAVTGAIVAAFEPPAIQGLGSFGGFQFELQDIDTVSHKIVGSSRQRADLVGLFNSFTANDPQQLVQIDREKAKAIGVPIFRSRGPSAFTWARSM